MNKQLGISILARQLNSIRCRYFINWKNANTRNKLYIHLTRIVTNTLTKHEKFLTISGFTQVKYYSQEKKINGIIIRSLYNKYAINTKIKFFFTKWRALNKRIQSAISALNTVERREQRISHGTNENSLLRYSLKRQRQSDTTMCTIFHTIKVHADRKRGAKSKLRNIVKTNAKSHLVAALNQWKMRNLKADRQKIKESINALNLKNKFTALSIIQRKIIGTSRKSAFLKWEVFMCSLRQIETGGEEKLEKRMRKLIFTRCFDSLRLRMVSLRKHAVRIKQLQ